MSDKSGRKLVRKEIHIGAIVEVGGSQWQDKEQVVRIMLTASRPRYRAAELCLEKNAEDCSGKTD